MIIQKTAGLFEKKLNGINSRGLPVIVVYPDFKKKSDICCAIGIRKQIRDLWDKLSVLRDNMDKVPTLHVPYDKALIISALEDPDLKVQTMVEPNSYFYTIDD